MSLYTALIPAAASLGGAALGFFGNKSASKKQVKALKEANKLQERAIAEATRIYDEQKELAAPGVTYLRQLTSVPVNGLYPDQVAAQEELRRQGLNDISHSGLRGSGRAVTAALKRIDSDFMNEALRQNRGTRQQAASTLAGPFFSAGSSTAGALLGGGNAAAENATNIGNAQAGATLANTELIGKALGDISSLAASEIKGRDSRYADFGDAIAKAFAEMNGEKATI